MKFIFTLFFSLIVGALTAQTGMPYLTHLEHKLSGVDNFNLDFSQAKEGQMIVANRRGLLLTDGASWEFLTTPMVVFSLEYQAESGRVYLAGKNECGYLSVNAKGEYEYKLLFKRINTDFLSIAFSDDKLFFYSSNEIVSIDKENVKQQKGFSSKAGFSVLFSHDRKVYAIEEKQGMFQLDDKKTAVKSAVDVSSYKQFFVSRVNKDNSLLMANSGELFWFNHNGFKKVDYQLEAYLKEAFVNSTTYLEGDKIAVGTIGGGVAIIDYRTGATVDIINYQSGLPDNEVYGLGVDHKNDLWIAHEFGITLVNLNLPLSIYSNYLGLEGKMISLNEFGGKLIVNSSDGVFYLDSLQKKEKDVIITQLLKKEIMTSEVKRKHRKLFGALYRKEAKETDIQPKYNYVQHQVVLKEEVKEEQLLSGVKLMFRKVEGVKGKVERLVVSDSDAFIITNLAVYGLNKAMEKYIILDNLITHDAFLVNDSSLALCTNDGLYTYNFSSKKLDKKSFSNQIIETGIKVNNEEICVASEDTIYYLTKERIIALPYANRYGDQIRFNLIEGKLHYFLMNDIFAFDKANSSFESVSLNSLGLSSTFHHRKASDLDAWVVDGDQWINLSDSTHGLSNALKFLPLFGEVKYIHKGTTGDLWCINTENQLYRIKVNAKGDFWLGKPELLIQKIVDSEGKFHPLGPLELSHNNNSLTFYFANPSFLNNKFYYRYRFTGGHERWSDWIESNSLMIPFLANGNHVVEIQMKNVLNELSEVQTIGITITPPFYLTWWFYLMEAIFFAFLLILSFILNRKAKITFVSKTLTFLTLILIVEFIHVWIEFSLNYDWMNSPIYQFILNAVLAMAIFPFERLLEKLITKGRNRAQIG